METDSLEDTLKNWPMLNVIKSVEGALARAKPNGASNHKRENLRATLYILVNMYDTGGFPKDETFDDCKQVDLDRYRHVVYMIRESINKFDVFI